MGTIGRKQTKVKGETYAEVWRWTWTTLYTEKSRIQLFGHYYLPCNNMNTSTFLACGNRELKQLKFSVVNLVPNDSNEGQADTALLTRGMMPQGIYG